MGDLRTWIAGIISAAAGGMSGAIAALVVDPTHFDMNHWGKITSAVVFVALTHVIAYLQKSPIPGYIDGRDGRDGKTVVAMPEVKS